MQDFFPEHAEVSSKTCRAFVQNMQKRPGIRTFARMNQPHAPKAAPCFHPFAQPVSEEELPGRFTYPFCYVPHPLCRKAAEEVQDYLACRADWQEELQGGKMFGVLLVRDKCGQTGYLAAFSGILAGQTIHPFFVPPVYDLLDPAGFFPGEEEEISALNRCIDSLRNNPHYTGLRQERQETEKRYAREMTEAKARSAEAKARRDRLRKDFPDDAELHRKLIAESQHEKASLRRLKLHQSETLEAFSQEIRAYEEEIERIRHERHARSAALQEKIFSHFLIYNARGQETDLYSLFMAFRGTPPPAGAGECAAPKLLQYAYRHGLHPLAMAEFWWGNSPKTEMRRHGHFYPSCKGKCEPILHHMLQGLRVEENPLRKDPFRDAELPAVYEDETVLVLRKPAGMLSVPGKTGAASVYEYVRRKYPEAEGPLVVHRLDMDTSGLLLVAKTKAAHQNLQAQFKNRTVRKRYTALLDGLCPTDEGRIDLPLCPDPCDRPRQMVSTEHGKPAVTTYRVSTRRDGRTRIAFFPHTGRTHQLRVHAAHPLGLNLPIVGDALYGHPAERLYLHAEFLEFVHPLSGEAIRVEDPAPF